MRTAAGPCKCSDGPIYRTCCVCSAWTLKEKSACSTCGHPKGSDFDPRTFEFRGWNPGKPPERPRGGRR